MLANGFQIVLPSLTSLLIYFNFQSGSWDDICPFHLQVARTNRTESTQLIDRVPDNVQANCRNG